MFKRFFKTAAIAALLILVMSACGSTVASVNDVLTLTAQNGNVITYTVTEVDNANNVLRGLAVVDLPQATILGIQRLQSARNNSGPQQYCSFEVTYTLPDNSSHEFRWGDKGCEKYQGWDVVIEEIETTGEQ